jgi:hypothetical protein
MSTLSCVHAFPSTVYLPDPRMRSDRLLLRLSEQRLVLLLGLDECLLEGVGVCIRMSASRFMYLEAEYLLSLLAKRIARV